MSQMPKRSKHRKVHRGRVRCFATRGNNVSFGEFGLMSLEAGWVSARQLEAGRVAASHFLGGEGKIHIRVFPDKPITSKPLETRMGKGKGEPDFWCAVVRPGTILYEVQGAAELTSRQALNRIAHKLPVRCKMVARRAKV
ncbi:MAG: 50S ribosomal protein L16 [Planctomycetes bacterium]|nr:50S ribosomal protein L16 [Planctomycetota bacterium]